ncbi:MAG: phosphatase PAP2 family protein [Bacteroidota bacterium]
MYILQILFTVSTFAQQAVDTIKVQSDTPGMKSKISKHKFQKAYSGSAFIIPGAAIAYGFIKLDNNALTRLDQEAKHEFYSGHPHRQFIVDDYLQFAPGAAVFVLNGLAVKGKNNVSDQSGIYLLSNIILNGTTQSLKRITAVTRPDGTPNAFPSGHAAEGFASAEFLRREYGEQSLWYTISGYTAAVSVGVLRMYNNRHWLSDVIAGAGVGVLSTKASYWLYPKIKKIFQGKSKNTVLISPTYNKGATGFWMVKTF